MGIQPTSAYTALSFITNSPQQRQTPADATAISAATSANSGDKTTISQAARNRAAEETKGRGSYDFTNMTPNEMGKLVSDGKITGWSFVLTEAQLQAGTRGLSGTALQDAWEAANNTPANYIQRITKGIGDSRMYGIDTTGLESILIQIQALQGTPATTSA